MPVGRTSMADIPGNSVVAKLTVASIASNAAAATLPIINVPYNAKVIGASMLFVTSRASGTKSNTITLVNLGTAGTGTTVLGTFLATAAYASYAPLALSLATNPTVTAGAVIGLVHASAAAGTTIEACEAVLHLQYI